jgi:hypothetical protein
MSLVVVKVYVICVNMDIHWIMKVVTNVRIWVIIIMILGCVNIILILMISNFVMNVGMDILDRIIMINVLNVKLITVLVV